MLELLLWIIVVGVIAWIIQGIPMSEPFRRAAIGVIVIILVVALFRALASGGLGLPSLR